MSKEEAPAAEQEPSGRKNRYIAGAVVSVIFRATVGVDLKVQLILPMLVLFSS